MEKMTDTEKKDLMNRLEKELPYDLGEDTEVLDNHVRLELYGKYYHGARESFSKFEIVDGKVKMTEIDGDCVKSIAEDIYQDVLKFFPKIKTFTIILQLD